MTAYIYSLVEDDGTVLYVGQTSSPTKREQQHRNSQRNYHEHGRISTGCSQFIPLDCVWQMRILEEVEKSKANAREAHYIKELDPLYNMVRMKCCLDSVWQPVGGGQSRVGDVSLKYFSGWGC